MHPRMVLYLLGVSVLLAASAAALAQSSGPSQATSDPQATALANQALVALGAGKVTDVTLTGTATRTVGPDSETGTFTLKAPGLTQSRMDLTLPSGVLTELRSASNGQPTGSWIFDGTTHTVANHNMFTDAAWFFPSLSALNYQAMNPSSVLKYIGQETRAGISVQHIQYFVPLPDDATGLAQHLSTEDIYLNSSTLLPVAITFSQHPDNNAIVDIPVEIDFSGYSVVSGVAVPLHIQKFFNGSLLLDISVQSAALNTGLTNADFTAQ